MLPQFLLQQNVGTSEGIIAKELLADFRVFFPVL
jgi:hypothetical protein